MATVFRIVENDDGRNKIQLAINSLVERSKTNKLTMNNSKTRVVTFHRSSPKINSQYYTLAKSDSHLDLGIIFDAKLKFHEHNRLNCKTYSTTHGHNISACIGHTMPSPSHATIQMLHSITNRGIWFSYLEISQHLMIKLKSVYVTQRGLHWRYLYHRFIPGIWIIRFDCQWSIFPLSTRAKKNIPRRATLPHGSKFNQYRKSSYSKA